MTALREFPDELEVEAGPRRDSWRLYIHGPVHAGVIIAPTEADALAFAEAYAAMRRDQAAATTAQGVPPSPAHVAAPPGAAPPVTPAGVMAAPGGPPGGEL